MFPENKRLTETEAMLTLLFDTAQLAFLLVADRRADQPLCAADPGAGHHFGQRAAPAVHAGSGRAGDRAGFAAARFTTCRWRCATAPAIAVPQLFEFGFWLSIVIGILFLGIYSRRVATEIRSMADALLATQMALAREQKLTDLGGVVAAAAHELGTPLATIKLVSTELIEELDDRPELRDDARLIREQADRCRDILRGMGRAGKDDLHLRVGAAGGGAARGGRAAHRPRQVDRVRRCARRRMAATASRRSCAGPS